MLPETHPLIEIVTEPLSANAERRMAAHAFLGEKFDAAHPGIANAAARHGRGSVTKKSRSGSSPPPRYVDGVRLSALPRETEFEIKDPVVFEEALELLEKAAAMPNFETYTNQMAAARMSLLPTDTLAEFTEALMHVDGAPGGMIELRHLADILSARAEQLSKTGRKEEFIALAKQRDALIAHIGRNPDSNFFGEYVYSIVASATATNFAFAAERLGLRELAETFRRQSDAFREEWDRLEIRRKKEIDPLPAEKFSSQAHTVIPFFARKVLSPPPVSAADFEPMRRAEHELFGGLGILATAILISFAALVVFLSLLISTAMIRSLAYRMGGVFGITDWVWVIGLGIVLPILFFLMVTRLTSLAGREYEVMHFKLALPGVQYAALLLALLIAPATAVRWRLGKQLGPFGFGDRFTVPLALAVLAMLAVWSLAALPFVERFRIEDRLTLAALAAPPVLCLCLLFANALRSILGKPAARLPHRHPPSLRPHADLFRRGEALARRGNPPAHRSRRARSRGV